MSSAMYIHQVPEVRDDLLRGRNWKAVAKMQRETHFARGRAGMDKKRVEALSKVKQKELPLPLACVYFHA